MEGNGKEMDGAATPGSGAFHRYLLDALEQALLVTDDTGNVVYMNQFAEQAYGWQRDEALGRSVLEIAPSELSPDETRDRIRRMVQGTRFVSERTLRRRDGSTFEASVIAKPVFDPDGRRLGVMGLATDVSARKEAERRREAQYAVTRALAESATLAEAVPAVVGAVASRLGWDLGVLWMVDWNAEVLRCIDIWQAIPGKHRVFDDVSRRMVFPRGVELCGRVWDLGAVVWISDTATALSPPRAAAAAQEGLSSAIGFPVIAARGTIGVVTFYGSRINEPDADMRALLSAIGSQIGLFTERREAERLESSLTQLRALSRRLVAVREEERARAAREFHDELGQSLTGLKLDLAWVGRHLAALPERPGHIEDKLREMGTQVDAVIHTVRQVITDLRPRVLDELGLVAAIEWLGHDFSRRSGTTCELQLNVQEIELDESRRTAVFRIFQEILTNVARHAGASVVTVGLTAEHGVLRLQVRDNGRGITDAELRARTSLGLLGMQERAQACNGTIEFNGAPGAGTTVTVRIPLDNRHTT